MRILKQRFILYFLLICANVGLFLNTYANNTITFSGKNVRLDTTFAILERQSSFQIVHELSGIQLSRKFNINLQNATINEALDSCIKGQELTYKIFYPERIAIIDERRKFKGHWFDANSGLITNYFLYTCLIFTIVSYFIFASIHKRLFSVGVFLLTIGCDYNYMRFAGMVEEQEYLSPEAKKKIVRKLEFLRQEIDSVQYIKGLNIYKWICRFRQVLRDAFYICHWVHFAESKGKVSH